MQTVFEDTIGASFIVENTLESGVAGATSESGVPKHFVQQEGFAEQAAKLWLSKITG